MIVKVFQKNKNGKIEFTKEELENLLNEIYWEGYNANTNTWTYTTPAPITIPKYQVTTGPTSTTDVSLGTEINKNEI